MAKAVAAVPDASIEGPTHDGGPSHVGLIAVSGPWSMAWSSRGKSCRRLISR